MEKVNLEAKFATFSEHWQPRIVGELNGQHVKVVRLLGEFVWHQRLSMVVAVDGGRRAPAANADRRRPAGCLRRRPACAAGGGGTPPQTAGGDAGGPHYLPSDSGARTRPATPQRISSVTTYGTASSR